jgi:hypothetical protein
MHMRISTALAVAALAFGGAACGESDDGDTDGTTPGNEAPLNDDTPSANPQTVAPNSDDVEPKDGGG